MPVADNWKCCLCGNIWSYELYAACVTCLHRNCVRCTSYSLWKRERTLCESNLVPSIQANIMHGRPQRIERGTLSGDLRTSNDESLQTFKIAGRTTPNQDNQSTNFASSPSSWQVKSITLPTRRPRVDLLRVDSKYFACSFLSLFDS